uniref:Uncharacterized protein n=1 Tax=Panagrolaimus sp. JU765 TaxID=591449 RepID=A0AC34RH05_9BILA
MAEENQKKPSENKAAEPPDAENKANSRAQPVNAPEAEPPAGAPAPQPIARDAESPNAVTGKSKSTFQPMETSKTPMRTSSKYSENVDEQAGKAETPNTKSAFNEAAVGESAKKKSAFKNAESPATGIGELPLAPTPRDRTPPAIPQAVSTPPNADVTTPQANTAIAEPTVLPAASKPADNVEGQSAKRKRQLRGSDNAEGKSGKKRSRPTEGDAATVKTAHPRRKAAPSTHVPAYRRRVASTESDARTAQILEAQKDDTTFLRSALEVEQTALLTDEIEPTNGPKPDDEPELVSALEPGVPTPEKICIQKKRRSGRRHFDKKSKKRVQEVFCNEKSSIEFVSPDSKSPTISERQIVDYIDDVRLGGMQFQWENISLKKFAVLFSCVVGFLNILNFPELVFRNGGVYFFIPYLICFFVIGLPMMYLELALGQYCSLPPATLFSRMGSLFAGIGYSMTVLRVLNAWSVFNHQTMYSFFASLGVSQDARRIWRMCQRIPLRDCVEPFRRCPNKNSALFQDGCFDVMEDLTEHKNITVEQAMTILSGSSTALREFYVHYYFTAEYYEPFSIFPITAAIFAAAVYGCLLMSGMKSISKAAVVVMVLSILNSIIMIVVESTGGYIPQVLELLKPENVAALWCFKTWRDAAIHVMTSFGIADGTLIWLGSMSKFNNNITKDVIFMAVCGFCANLMGLITTMPFMVMLAHELFDVPGPIDLTLRQKVEFLGPNWNMVLHEYLLPFFGLFQNGPYFSAIISFSLFGMTIALQSLTGEMTLTSFYRAFPSLLSIEEVYFRKFFGAAYFCLFFLFCTATANPFYYTIVGPFISNFMVEQLIPIVALFELVLIISHYKFSRFMTNIGTMTKSRSSNFVWNVARIMWCCLTPAALFAMTIVSVIRIEEVEYALPITALGYCLVATLGGLFLWIFLIKLVYYKVKKKNTHFLFECAKNWGPQLTEDRNKAEFDERAARVRN